MTTTHQNLVASQFGPQAAAYVASPVHAQGEDLQQMAAAVRGMAGARVLDLGCGGGHVSFNVAPHVREVVAYDLSRDMLGAVAATAQARGLANIATQQGTVESLPFPDPVQPNADGTELIPYVPGKDGPPLTIGGELNKLCSNITFGRNILGVHYRADSEQGNHVGEECAIRILAEQQGTIPQAYNPFVFTRFNGEKVSV